jgi:hypothetical protein
MFDFTVTDGVVTRKAFSGKVPTVGSEVEFLGSMKKVCMVVETFTMFGFALISVVVA